MQAEAMKTDGNGAPKGVPELNAVKEEHARAFFFPKWSQEYLDLIKSQCCPPGIGNAEFAMFIEQARRAELDPIKAECDCVPRNVKVKTRHPNGQTTEDWVTKWVFQAREQGMSARADRFEDYGGIEAAAVYQKDQITIDEAAGKVEHKWSPTAERGPLIGAWAKATRIGRKVPIEWLPVRDYAQDNAMWKAKGHTMIVKCARAATLRRAYPNTFGDCYVGEEMADALTPATVEAMKTITDGNEKLHQTIETPATSRTETVAAKVAAKAAAVAPAATKTVDAKPEPKTEAKPADPKPAEGPTAKFGNKERIFGRLLADLSSLELEELAAAGTKAVNDPESKKEKWFEKVRDNLVEVNSELLKRKEAAKPAPAVQTPADDAEAPF